MHLTRKYCLFSLACSLQWEVFPIFPMKRFHLSFYELYFLATFQLVLENNSFINTHLYIFRNALRVFLKTKYYQKLKIIPEKYLGLWKRFFITSVNISGGCLLTQEHLFMHFNFWECFFSEFRILGD